jgi:putative acetyltransferase
MNIRPEHHSDCDSIHRLLIAAFADHPHSQHNEQTIVAVLRAANALAVSLVADDDGIVGYIACSPVSINGSTGKWFGLGPVAVQPDRQGKSIGAALVRASIEQLKSANAEGIVLLGEPHYYQRFGFAARPELQLSGVPASHFLALVLHGPIAQGVVTYHPAFDSE